MTQIRRRRRRAAPLGGRYAENENSNIRNYFEKIIPRQDHKGAQVKKKERNLAPNVTASAPTSLFQPIIGAYLTKGQLENFNTQTNATTQSGTLPKVILPASLDLCI